MAFKSDCFIILIPLSENLIVIAKSQDLRYNCIIPIDLSIFATMKDDSKIQIVTHFLIEQADF